MRRTLDQTRQLLLDTGVDALHERGVFVGVTHIRLADVARAAGMTTGAAYRVWRNQEEFHRDLAVAAVEHRDRGPTEQTIRRVLDLLVEEAPLAELLRVGSLANLHDRSPDEAFLIALGLRALGGSVPELAEASRARHEASVASYEDLYSFLMRRYGRRMRPPLPLSALSHALAALSEGFAVQAMSGVGHPHYELECDDDGVGSRWSLLAIAVEGVVERLTEPIPGAPDRPAAHRGDDERTGERPSAHT